jgi:hypothetical protein
VVKRAVKGIETDAARLLAETTSSLESNGTATSQLARVRVMARMTAVE